MSNGSTNNRSVRVEQGSDGLQAAWLRYTLEVGGLLRGANGRGVELALGSEITADGRHVFTASVKPYGNGEGSRVARPSIDDSSWHGADYLNTP